MDVRNEIIGDCHAGDAMKPCTSCGLPDHPQQPGEFVYVGKEKLCAACAEYAAWERWVKVESLRVGWPYPRGDYWEGVKT